MKQEDLNGIFDQLFDNAMQDYLHMEEYKYLREKREQVDRGCETILTEDEWKFIQECFETLAEISCHENQYAYRRGMRDCVSLLRALRVLA